MGATALCRVRRRICHHRRLRRAHRHPSRCSYQSNRSCPHSGANISNSHYLTKCCPSTAFHRLHHNCANERPACCETASAEVLQRSRLSGGLCNMDWILLQLGTARKSVSSFLLRPPLTSTTCFLFDVFATAFLNPTDTRVVPEMASGMGTTVTVEAEVVPSSISNQGLLRTNSQ